MKIITSCAALAMGFSLFAAPGWAARELFASTEIAPKAAQLEAIEPAAGASAEVKPHGEDKHAEGAAPAGKAEGEVKSSSGKVLTGPTPLPAVRIGGQLVRREVERRFDAETLSTPKSLQGPGIAQQLQNRLSLNPFAHSPRLGSPQAPITIIVFEDLSCVSCTANSQAINTALQDVLSPTADTSLTQVLWVHAANQRWQGTNLPAFYAKVAAKQGKFYEYRSKLLEAPERSAEAAFAILVGLGLEPRDIRQTMLTEARRFYRELDGDLLQARSFGIGVPPTVLVNGIRVGEGWLPMELLPDVITYVKNRYNNGLNEPPL